MNREPLDITIDEFTSPFPFVANLGTDLTEVSHFMDVKGIRHIPVVDDKKPVGIISERDLTTYLAYNDGKDKTAEDVMTKEPFCVPTGTPLEEVAFELSKRKIGSAIVTNEKGEADGIFTSTDGLNALIEVIRGEA